MVFPLRLHFLYAGLFGAIAGPFDIFNVTPATIQVLKWHSDF
ncbi:hypothetical protein L798_05153 [Zootermopsis nevadensis]|uniref:Uncharacterized protein n=1 Tax=Zootermopsis nevadensis TaxID=136037 RepID=A0A067RAD4_ZOONE|nr:hypothetical protein L798_05153 [Zootermopsis nevadensis]